MRIALSILFACVAMCELRADSMQWVVISDTHYGGTAWTWGGGDSISNEVYYCETNHNPAFIVHAGDVSETSASSLTTCGSSSYPAYITDMSVLSVPYYNIAGNHDLPAYGGTSGLLVCWEDAGFESSLSWTNGNYVFIGFGSYWTGSNGTVRESDLDYLEATLNNAHPLYTNFVVISHLPAMPDATFGEINSGYGLERMTNLFNQYGVDLYIHGHTHQPNHGLGTIENTETQIINVGSLTRYLSGRGTYTLFGLTNSTLTATAFRTDTHAVIDTDNFTFPSYSGDSPSLVRRITATTANAGTVRGP